MVSIKDFIKQKISKSYNEKRAYINPVFQSIVAFILLVSCLIVFKVEANKIRCAEFESRETAQFAYDLNPKLFAKLDGKDKDGKVCEYYKYN